MQPSALSRQSHQQFSEKKSGDCETQILMKTSGLRTSRLLQIKVYSYSKHEKNIFNKLFENKLDLMYKNVTKLLTSAILHKISNWFLMLLEPCQGKVLKSCYVVTQRLLTCTQIENVDKSN